MTDTAIRVEGLSKRYLIGAKQQAYRTLRDTLTDAAQAPFRRLSAIARGESSRVCDETIWALKDVSFEVKRGEVLGVIGPNGAGKTTLLKILSRITEPTQGRAEIRGRVGSLLEVGTGFHPELTGRENIYLNGAILGMTKAEIDRKYDEIVDFSGVEKFIDTPVKHYSSGMHVRLAFSVAAHLDPEILLIDEVLAVGDAAFQKKCLGKMDEVARKGRTVLFVSHNMGSVQSLASRCIHLEQGHKAGSGPTSKMIKEYLRSIEISRTHDFTDAARLSSEHGKKIRICRITPQQPNEVAFYFDQDLIFEVELESNLQRQDLRFGITISAITGTAVLSTFSPNAVGVHPTSSVTYHVTITDSRLAPGTYTLALSIGEGGHDEGRLEYDVVSPGPVFAVASVALDGTSVFQWRKAYGHVLHRGCSVKKCPEESSLGRRGGS